MKNLNQAHQLQSLTEIESLEVSGGILKLPTFRINWFLEWLNTSAESSVITVEKEEEVGGFGGGSFGGGGSGGSW